MTEVKSEIPNNLQYLEPQNLEARVKEQFVTEEVHVGRYTPYVDRDVSSSSVSKVQLNSYRLIDLDGDGYTDDVVGLAKVRFQFGKTDTFWQYYEKEAAVNCLFVISHSLKGGESHFQVRLLNQKGELLSRSLHYYCAGYGICGFEDLKSIPAYEIVDLRGETPSVPAQAQELLFPFITAESGGPLILGIQELFGSDT